MSDINEEQKRLYKKAEENDIQILSRWQDPTIDDLIKENLELKRKLGEADDAVEYWQTECDKRSKVLDKIKKYVLEVSQETLNNGRVFYNGTPAQTILELLEEIK